MLARTRLLVVAAAVVCAVGVLSAQSVKFDFDPTVDFSKYTTYFWAKTDPTPNDLANQRILAEVDHWLTTKGLTKAPQDKASVAIVSLVTTEKEKSINTFYDTMGGGWGYRGWGGMGMGSATTTTSTYTTGTMIVDMYDASTKKLVWRGIATDTLSDDPQKNAKKVQKATEKMFKDKFPPKPKK